MAASGNFPFHQQRFFSGHFLFLQCLTPPLSLLYSDIIGDKIWCYGRGGDVGWWFIIVCISSSQGGTFTYRQIYKSSKSPSRSLPGKGKGPDDPHSRQKTGNGSAEVSIEGKLPHFDTGIVPVRRSPTSNLGDFLKKMQKYWEKWQLAWSEYLQMFSLLTITMTWSHPYHHITILLSIPWLQEIVWEGQCVRLMISAVLHWAATISPMQYTLQYWRM